MSPKNIHLIFALLLCLWVSCADFKEKSDSPEYHFASTELEYHNSSSSLIKGIPKKIIVENVPGNVGFVKVSWPRPMVNGTVSQFSSSHRPGDLFQVGQSTEVTYKMVRPTGERATATFLVEVKRSPT